jgi:radical SAM superfamily enzyme YgiQ (UPF0313 family)
MNKVKDVTIGMVQINTQFSNQYYIPYTVGMFQAYINAHSINPKRYRFLLPVFKKDKPENIAEQLNDADIVFFSSYLWNLQISLHVAKEIKRNKPNVIIVFGGPNVPFRSNAAETFLSKHRFIDMLCHGEGEQTVLDIVENFPNIKNPIILGTSYLDGDKYVRGVSRERIKNLDKIPSPYLNGIFEPLIEANPDIAWLGMQETNRGCPFSCFYCDWGSSVSQKILPFKLERVYNEIDWFADNKVEFIFVCDANFGILKRDLDIADYVVNTRKKTGYPQAYSVQNTKNMADRTYKIQKLLSEGSMNKGVSLAIQTTSQAALKNIGRKNISLESFHELQEKFASDGVKTYSDIILGLPGETLDSLINGACNLIRNGQHHRIQFINLSLLPNSQLADPEYVKQHEIKTVRTKIVNHHGSIINQTINEYQDLVISTNTMPVEDWIQTRVLCWLIGLLYFNKLLQLPLMILEWEYKIKLESVFNKILDLNFDEYPIFSELVLKLKEHAEQLVEGGDEYFSSEDWLPLWWPVEEYMLIKLVHDNKLNAFYDESFKLFSLILENNNISQPSWFYSIFQFNKDIICKPFMKNNITHHLECDLWDFRDSILLGGKNVLKKGKFTYEIKCDSRSYDSFDDWCRYVIWYGQRNGDYLFPIVQVN